MTRRDYPIHLIVNGTRINRVVIDPHYEKKHAASIHDALILDLVRMLAGKSFEIDSESGGFQYFVSDNLMLGTGRYKLIWLLEANQSYLGIVNAYRRKR